VTATGETVTPDPGCCEEPECRRRYPIAVYMADFSERVFAATGRRVVSEHADGTATFAATERHDITAQVREFVFRNPAWVRAILDNAERGERT